MLFKKGELKILWPFYLNGFMIGLSFMIYPFLVIYLRGLGFSFLQIGIIAAAYDLGMVLFEVPTGAFADSVSRKTSVIMGYALAAAPFTLIYFFSDFYAILILWVLGAIGMTFVSGADEAWVIDNLKHHKRKDLQHEYFIKNSSIASISAIFSPFIGALLVKAGLIRVLWLILGGGFFLIALMLAAFAKELYKPQAVNFKKAFSRTFRNSGEAVRYVKSNRHIFLFIIGSTFIALTMIGEWGWQPFLVKLGLPTYALGWVYSILAIGWVIVPFLSKLFLKMELRKAVAIMTGLRVLLLGAIMFVFPPFFLIGASIMIFDGSFKSMQEPLLRTYLHKWIPTNIRATLVSINNIGTRLIFAMGEIAGGALLDAFGPQKVIALGAVFGIFAIATFWKIGKQKLAKASAKASLG